MADEHQPLSYDRAGGQAIPRWQFRLLFLLVLLNLVISIQSSYAPGVGTAVKRRWAEYQESRRVQALQTQALDWSEPPGKVMWDDDPKSAAPLLAGHGYKAVNVAATIRHNYPFLSGWPPGAGARQPDFATQLFRPHFPISAEGLVQSSEDDALVFMHGLTSPGGMRRIVYVYLKGSTDIDTMRVPVPPGGGAPPAAPFEAAAKKRLRLIAVPCVPAEGATLPKTLARESSGLTIAPGGAGEQRFTWKWRPPADGRPGEVEAAPADRFRFYAGQPGPADRSRFTVDYEHNGRRGRISGRLKDDGAIDLKPDVGVVTGDQWDPNTR